MTKMDIVVFFEDVSLKIALYLVSLVQGQFAVEQWNFLLTNCFLSCRKTLQHDVFEPQHILTMNIIPDNSCLSKPK